MWLKSFFSYFSMSYSHLPWSRAAAPQHIYRMNYAKRMSRMVPRWDWKVIYHFLPYNCKQCKPFTIRICRFINRNSTWRTYLAPFLPLLSLLPDVPSSKLFTLGGKLYLLLLTSRLSANAKTKVFLNKSTCYFYICSTFLNFRCALEIL